ncbi:MULTISPECIES: ornithine carbamoyltransferase [Aeribacillus]|jgi:ornithine carbamoyltransferase|uniref:Ornithine carbamoyltransferase n=1 Tax=Aeribacillus pallidus TaxID=33936 RepID=A0A165YPT5_9BACI|nr:MULTISPECIES: ornithine carbamoyltransferase [Aeribacillus]KZN97321.1 ornithine carbamoyltransferase [Aeribacillus pallidus]MDR9796444.1 ornithine carbamoyltransferase [Aeribacillus pallidus]MED1442811.1 ornithine carbamoyltransferase [Aeribacillus composti]RZI51643.1 ornithine carbamoyltransferase [Aeribacillus pallidus]
MSTLKGRNVLKLLDFTSEEIQYLLEEALKLKQNPLSNVLHGKTLAMIFEKSSTRTRVSFEVGMLQLGGHALALSSKELQLGRGETIADTARVLSRYVDAILLRTTDHNRVKELAEYATVPVINGLCDLYHPCQALADLLTIYELKGKFSGVKVVYVGDGNNVAHSLMVGCAKVGAHFTIAAPEGYEPNESILKQAKEIAGETGGKVELIHNPDEAVQDADIIYTDVWVSMGQEEETEARMKAFKPFQVNQSLLAKAKRDVSFLHCLPAARGLEVTDEVMDGSQSAVFLQAENRLHAQKAILKEIMA